MRAGLSNVQNIKQLESCKLWCTFVNPNLPEQGKCDFEYLSSLLNQIF
jgi:hypothetical protein